VDRKRGRHDEKYTFERAIGLEGLKTRAQGAEQPRRAKLRPPRAPENIRHEAEEPARKQMPAEKEFWPNWNCFAQGRQLHNKQF
jgi:hypothetical protein